jgi:hypothetical protein
MKSENPPEPIFIGLDNPLKTSKGQEPQAPPVSTISSEDDLIEPQLVLFAHRMINPAPCQKVSKKPSRLLVRGIG